MKNSSLSHLLADGFAERMAHEYLDTMVTERESGLFDHDYMEWAHSNGFFAQCAYSYRLNDNNLSDYMSDYDFYKLWPLNDWQRIWINDKLTLKYMLADTGCDQYMPEYYYYTAKHRLLPCPDTTHGADISGFLATLREKGEFACKPCNGAMAVGFHKLSFADGRFFVDGVESSEQSVLTFVQDHPNYIFTEFLRPEESMARIDPLIHTLRVIVINESGTNPIPMASYLRFSVGADKSGSTPNYVIPTKADICSLNLDCDLDTGRYGNAKLVYPTHVEDCPLHPDSKMPTEGIIPCWSDVLDMLQKVYLHLNACEYLGYDIGITPDGPRIMEINSHSGVQYIQLFRPLRKDPVAADYYERKLRAIDALSPDDRQRRNHLTH